MTLHEMQTGLADAGLTEFSAVASTTVEMGRLIRRPAVDGELALTMHAAGVKTVKVSVPSSGVTDDGKPWVHGWRFQLGTSRLAAGVAVELRPYLWYEMVRWSVDRELSFPEKLALRRIEEKFLEDIAPVIQKHRGTHPVVEKLFGTAPITGSVLATVASPRWKRVDGWTAPLPLLIKCLGFEDTEGKALADPEAEEGTLTLRLDGKAELASAIASYCDGRRPFFCSKEQKQVVESWMGGVSEELLLLGMDIACQDVGLALGERFLRPRAKKDAVAQPTAVPTKAPDLSKTG